MSVLVPKKLRKADMALFAQMLCLNFSVTFLLGFLFKQTDMQSLEGVINDMYVQFQVMAKVKSQEIYFYLPIHSFRSIHSIQSVATLLSARYHIEIIHCDLPHTS